MASASSPQAPDDHASTWSMVANDSHGPLASTTLQTTASSSSAADTTTSPAAASNAAEISSLDFIGAGRAVKKLFSIPLAEQPVCVAVHNIDGTLLIDDEVIPDDCDDSGSSVASAGNDENDDGNRSSSPKELPPSSQSLELALSPVQNGYQDNALLLLSQMIQNSKSSQGTKSQIGPDLPPTKSLATSSSSPLINSPPLPPVREYVQWQFKDMNLLVGSDALIVRPENASAGNSASDVTVRVEEVQRLRRMMQSGSPSIEEQKEAALPPPKSYAAALQLQHARDDNSTSQGARPLNLDQVQLQTCIVPSIGPLGGWLSAPSAPLPPSKGDMAATTSADSTARLATSSPKCLVLDAYLDNLMANVPQLALCLQEKGLITSVKLMDRDQIPAMMMHPSTLDTSRPVETVPNNTGPDLFSPEIMEMNASALLRFLKANCTSDNTTYLLRTDVSNGNNIQLFDISSISQQRQKKWIWWLATMSYRFALRLRQLESHDVLPMRQRAFRDRQRNLLQTTLDLLQDMRDMDGNAHESLVASVHEHYADTFLGETSTSNASEAGNPGAATTMSSPSPVMPSSASTATSRHRNSSSISSPIPISSTTPPSKKADQVNGQHQPYASIPTDGLNKAQDHLVLGIKSLWPVLEAQIRPSRSQRPTTAPKNSSLPARRRRKRGESKATNIFPEQKQEQPSPAMTSQLFGLNYKLVNVTLRLAEHFLRQYSSSSAMQSLRHAARNMADSISLLEYISTPEVWIPRLRLQYTWLWEHCGHFARSFASDNLWRDRGHASGDDILYVLKDVEAAFVSSPLPYNFSNLPDPMRTKSKGFISLQSLSALYSPMLGEAKKEKREIPEIWEEARILLSNQGLLQRDKRQVLVASCISYTRAIACYQDLSDEFSAAEDDSSKILDLLRQRLGDACNETGKMLLAVLRSFLSIPKAGTQGLADIFLDSAQFWFLEGLEAFESSGDPRNVALLRCNLCQCCKLRANASFTSQAVADATTSHAEVCLEKAASHLQAAHEKLGTRDTDPTTWDMVSNELAATFLVLAVRRRQSLLGGGAIPVVLEALRLTPGKERSILEPMEKALAIYQQAGNYHQAAAVQYQLALTNSKVWTCQRDETKTRAKLSAAFTQYQHAFSYFACHLPGNEPTFVLLCLDIASLYAAVSGEECLIKALTRCLDTAEAFSPNSIGDGMGHSKEWLEQMNTLSASVDDRVFKLLRNLVKLDGDRWKDLYREGLSAKMTAKGDTDEQRPQIQNLTSSYKVLVALRAKFTELNNSSNREGKRDLF